MRAESRGLLVAGGWGVVLARLLMQRPLLTFPTELNRADRQTEALFQLEVVGRSE